MTTNLNAIAGPSKQMSPASTISVSVSPKPEPESPEFIGDLSGLTAAATGDMSASGSASGGAGAVNKSGLSVDENGEVVKVPAFLQKLFSMVSDPGTDTLIYWAESGDSFFVPNHERFGKEILPRFFKHSNFSSFVRQLNMYGFHKVPQPQTGVLKADNPNESELWEFVNPFFKRGKAHLLSRVMRKNNRPGNPPPTATAPNPNATRSSSRQASNTASSNATGLLSSTGQYLITDGTTEGEAGIMVGPSGQQMIDLSAITNGIAAIQRTQASIGADLKALQSSNELLWREAAVQREKNQKHQETIDLIVTFLERLFGTEGEGLKGLKEAMRRGGLGSKREDTGDDNTGSSKKRKRLGIDRMISDGRDEHVGEDGQIVEISESPNSVDPFNLSLPRYRSSQTQRSDQLSSSDPWSSTSQRFTNLPSEEEGSPFNPASSSASTRLPTPNTNNANQLFSPLSDSANNLPAIDPSALVPYFQQQQSTGQRANNQDGPSSNQPLSPGSTAAAASAFNLDPSILQTTIGSLLQSPAAAQMFLNSLNNSAQGQALQTPSKLNPNQAQPQAAGSGFPFNGPNRGNGFDTNSIAQDELDPTLALFSPLRHQNALLQNDEALMKSYQEAVGINGDVEKLQDSIDSLVRSMGLDLPDSTNQLSTSTSDLNANTTGGDNGLGGLDSDFNVDDFLEHLAQDDK